MKRCDKEDSGADDVSTPLWRPCRGLLDSKERLWTQYCEVSHLPFLLSSSVCLDYKRCQKGRKAHHTHKTWLGMQRDANPTTSHSSRPQILTFYQELPSLMWWMRFIRDECGRETLQNGAQRVRSGKATRGDWDFVVTWFVSMKAGRQRGISRVRMEKYRSLSVHLGHEI